MVDSFCVKCDVIMLSLVFKEDSVLQVAFQLLLH